MTYDLLMTSALVASEIDVTYNEQTAQIYIYIYILQFLVLLG